MEMISALLDYATLSQQFTFSSLNDYNSKSPLWEDRSDQEIDTVVIHFISAEDFYPKTPFVLELIFPLYFRFGVSAHYMIDRDGTIYHLVPEEKKAWHCGGSIMPEPDNRQWVNSFSIGIELVATAESGYTKAQYTALGELTQNIETRWDIKSYVGHDEIAGDRAVSLGLRKDCKPDPGKHFQWDTFHAKRSL